jgi:hypothetical protein
MSTLVEIEEAIQTLPADKVAELLRWLEDYQAMIGAAEALAELYTAEESNVRPL